MEPKTKSKQYVLVILTIHFLLYLSIGVNVPIVRQLIGFIYLSFVPGFVCIGFLKIRRANIVDNVLFSAGLSIALLMFLGLFVSILGPTLGIAQPLSLIPLIIIVSGATLILFILECRKEISKTLELIPSEELNIGNISKAVLIILLPILSALAAIYAKESILLIILVIAVIFVFSAFSARIVPVKFYPLLICAISLAMALQFTLMSEHIMGADAPLEYRVYKLTEINGIWQPLKFGPPIEIYYASMLSITVLPTVYSVILGMNGEVVFKLFYPFVFCLVPLALYRICCSQKWRPTFSILAAFFLVSSPLVFYGVEPLSLNRQIVGSLFFMLSIYVLVEGEIQAKNRRLLLLIFGASLAVSHYALMFTYLAFLTVIFVYSKIRSRPDNVLHGTIAIALYGFSLAWYWLFSGPMITEIGAAFQRISSNFVSDLSNPAARSSDVFTPHKVQTVASSINWILFAITHFFIIVGILVAILRPKKTGFTVEYRIVLFVSSLMLFLAVAIPNFAPILNFSRFYAITLLFLAPCFVLGGKTFLLSINEKLMRLKGIHVNQRLLKMNSALLLIGILTSSYFLSQSGFINYVTGGSILSTTLGWNELKATDLSKSLEPQATINFYVLYIPDEDVLSAEWLSKVMANDSLIYSDFVSMDHPLQVYGLISRDNLLILTNTTYIENNSFIYLRSFNVASGLITTSPSIVFNVTEISPVLYKNDCIYTNGNSEIYRGLSG
jgi:uncharacterized membrane protein